MLTFPNIKINIGLNIVDKRQDGFHNLQTVFYPLPYFDILEIIEDDIFSFMNCGIPVDCKIEDNLVVRAYKLLEASFSIPPVKIILYKNVPFGTGLGAGSSDAAHTLLLLNEKFKLEMSACELEKIASLMGSDCAFFIRNRPVYAVGRGDVFEDINVDLKGKYILLCFPEISVSTANAYKGCKPQMPESSLFERIHYPIEEWKEIIKNDFEHTIFSDFPVLRHIKEELYEIGAIYAQMSGSGSAIFGIFENKPTMNKMKNCTNYKIIEL